jgi:hypothetical protein
MKMMVSWEDLQFDMESEPWWGSGIFHFPIILSLAELKASVCEQKDLHIDLTKDWVKNPLNKSPVSYPKTN